MLLSCVDAVSVIDFKVAIMELSPSYTDDLKLFELMKDALKDGPGEVLVLVQPSFLLFPSAEGKAKETKESYEKILSIAKSSFKKVIEVVFTGTLLLLSISDPLSLIIVSKAFTIG